MTAQAVKAALQRHASADDAIFLQRFFKTDPGQYGEGDRFIGVRVPMTRQVCRQFKDLSLPEVQTLLNSPVHEHRLAAVIILAAQYPKSKGSAAIYDLYLKNVISGRINNWDIIDTTAEYVIGAHLKDRPKAILFKLARSNSMWQKRTALMSTFGYIKAGDPSPALDIINVLLHDPNDLVQKAVGWMLREIGKRVDEAILIDFLDKHAADMPRTALRYALEKLSPDLKAQYMQAKFN